MDEIEGKLDTIETTANAIQTAVEILDDWDDSNYANVNINLAGSDAPTGGGTESGALRVTIANDGTGGGIRLAPGDFYSIDVNNTADIYVLASVDEEDIHFTYFT